MAKVIYNVVTHGVTGRVGDLLTFIQRHGKTYIGKIRAKSSGNVSANQQAVRDKFQQAIKYAKASMNDPEKKALYAKGAAGGVTPFNLALADFMSVPVIQAITADNYTGAVGSTIEVQATDDTSVTELQVSIANATGAIVEEGLAVLNAESDLWIYSATVVNPLLAGSKITATAKDLPGNSTPLEKLL